MVELHALWDVPAACRIASALDEFEPAWIEDPVRVSSPGALAEVQRATRTPLAVGETLTGLASYRDLITRGGAQIIVFDVGWVGGLSEATAIAATIQRRFMTFPAIGDATTRSATRGGPIGRNTMRRVQMRGFDSLFSRGRRVGRSTVPDFISAGWR